MISILRFSAEDTGTYTCFASNSLGADQAATRIYGINKNKIFKKLPFSARKMRFFDKNGNVTHWTARDSASVKEYFFPLVFFYLNSKGFFGARWGTW